MSRLTLTITAVATAVAFLLLSGCTPPTATTSTASAPSPAPTPAGLAASTRSLVDAVADRGVPIAHVICSDEDTDPNGMLGRPGGYVARCAWRDARLGDRPLPPDGQWGVDDGGAVEVYLNAEDAADRLDVLAGFDAGAGALSAGWSSLAVGEGGQHVVVRGSSELTGAQWAELYEAVQAAVAP